MLVVNGEFSCSHAGCLVQRTGWTRDVDIFLHWLSAMPFAGGGFNDAAIAEGLGEAIMVRKTCTLLLFLRNFLLNMYQSSLLLLFG